MWLLLRTTLHLTLTPTMRNGICLLGHGISARWGRSADERGEVGGVGPTQKACHAPFASGPFVNGWGNANASRLMKRPYERACGDGTFHLIGYKLAQLHARLLFVQSSPTLLWASLLF